MSGTLPAASPTPPTPTASPGSDHPMRRLRLLKVVVNIGVGEAGERRTKAERVITMLTGHKPVSTRAKSTNRDLGTRLGMEIGAKVTLRGSDADAFLRRALKTREDQLDPDSVDRAGNFAFGVPDYTDFDGMKYDPKIGIYGLDVCVELARPGVRIRARSRSARPLPRRQRPNPQETRRFLEQAFGVKFLE
ncbi:Ribosomal protein L5 [mine drainage metagenome]|uniref:Ribosomal protein L5 n=1 Tax=mine drainage metagenome TaxID=410659 RepID=T0Z0D4_9ZZZZ